MMSDRQHFLQSAELLRAVGKILDRSEKLDDAKTISTYVDIGIRDKLSNENNQIIYGRRGTGKTHVLRLIGQYFAKQGDGLYSYIDARALGSSPQFRNIDLPIDHRCLSLFRDLFGVVEHDLLKYCSTNLHGTQQNAALERLQELSTAITGERKRKASVSSEKKEDKKQTETYDIVESNKISFPDLYRPLEQILSNSNTRLFILLDEWSEVPSDIQPFLAEFLKRTIIPNRHATLKISALENNSVFSVRENNRIVGLELGADISTVDLDDYFIFGRNKERIMRFYSNVLYKHIDNCLAPDSLAFPWNITTPEQLVSNLFHDSSNLEELSLAAEGVVRDLIRIFVGSYYEARNANKGFIDKNFVRYAANNWFNQDKLNSLQSDAKNGLTRISDLLLKRKRRRFGINTDLAAHPVIQELLAARVIHLLERGHVTSLNPGVRYNVYNLDYGTYVRFIDTQHEPRDPTVTVISTDLLEG